MRTLCAIVFSLSFGLALADIRPEFSGAWYNADQPGHGLSVQVLDDERTIAFWYAYTPAGHPMFLVIDGVNDHHTVTGPAYYHEGMIWGLFDPDTLSSEVWGEVRIEFIECNRAVLTWTSDAQGYGEGVVAMERLSFVAGLRCDDVPDEMTGEWLVQILDRDGRPFAENDPYAVVVDANGEFEFEDASSCRWGGHIHVQSAQRGYLTGFYGGPDCMPSVPMSFAYGMYYANGITFCNSGGGCVSYDQAMSLAIEYVAGYDGRITLIFLR